METLPLVGKEGRPNFFGGQAPNPEKMGKTKAIRALEGLPKLWIQKEFPQKEAFPLRNFFGKLAERARPAIGPRKILKNPGNHGFVKPGHGGWGDKLPRLHHFGHEGGVLAAKAKGLGEFFVELGITGQLVKDCPDPAFLAFPDPSANGAPFFLEGPREVNRSQPQLIRLFFHPRLRAKPGSPSLAEADRKAIPDPKGEQSGNPREDPSRFSHAQSGASPSRPIPLSAKVLGPGPKRAYAALPKPPENPRAWGSGQIPNVIGPENPNYLGFRKVGGQFLRRLGIR